MSVEIYWDNSNRFDAGWAYRSDDGVWEGPINHQAADAIDRICESMPTQEWDYYAIKKAIGHRDGEKVEIVIGTSGLHRIDITERLQ